MWAKSAPGSVKFEVISVEVVLSGRVASQRPKVRSDGCPEDRSEMCGWRSDLAQLAAAERNLGLAGARVVNGAKAGHVADDRVHKSTK